VGEQSGHCILQGIVFYALRHVDRSFEFVGYDDSMEPRTARPVRGAAICSRPARFGRFAPSSLRSAANRKVVRSEITETMLH